MHVFVTGATGVVGKALIPKLLAKGHVVSGLGRSQASLDKLSGWGVKPIQGAVTDVDVMKNAAKDADAVIHLAFDHDKAFAGGIVQACEDDRAAITAMCDGLLEGSSKHKVFMYSSGVIGSPTEKDEPAPNPHWPRHRSTELMHTYAPKGVRQVIVRLAAVTFGPDSPHPFISGPISHYKEAGYVAYPEGGVWAALDVNEAVDVFVLALDNDKLPNPVNLHATGTEPVPMKDAAEALGKKLGLPAKELPSKEVAANFGLLGGIMAMAGSSRASNEWTKEVLGWDPKGKDLIQQIGEWSY